MNETQDLKEMKALFPYIRKYQELSSKHGIKDIFQDNGGKDINNPKVPLSYVERNGKLIFDFSDYPF